MFYGMFFYKVNVKKIMLQLPSNCVFHCVKSSCKLTTNKRRKERNKKQTGGS